jgi:aspartate aminotransferase-like enzyme
VKWVRWHRHLTWIDLLRRALSTVTAVTLPTTNTRLTAVRTGAQKRSAPPGVTFWITSVDLLACSNNTSLGVCLKIQASTKLPPLCR